MSVKNTLVKKFTNFSYCEENCKEDGQKKKIIKNVFYKRRVFFQHCLNKTKCFFLFRRRRRLHLVYAGRGSSGCSTMLASTRPPSWILPSAGGAILDLSVGRRHLGSIFQPAPSWIFLSAEGAILDLSVGKRHLGSS
jgi:hypothetical protein